MIEFNIADKSINPEMPNSVRRGYRTVQSFKEVIKMDTTKDRVVPDSQPPVNADHSPPPSNDLGRFLRTDDSK